MLLSSDAHLRAIDHEELTLVLHPYQLLAPVIATISRPLRSMI